MKKFNVTLIALLITVVFVLSTVFAACTPGEPSDSNKLPDKDVCNHSLTRVAAVKETCTTEGNLQYWFCSKCGKYFADGNAANEIDKNDATIAAHHTLTHESERKATCTTDGNVDYFHCSVCGDNFLDENGKNKVDLDDTVIASKGHVVGEQWEHDENGHWKVCSACGQQVDLSSHNFQEYVCQDCGAIDEANRPLTEKEIVEKMRGILEESAINLLRPDSIVDFLALDYKFEENTHKAYILVIYTNSITGAEREYFALISIPLTNELSSYNVKKGLCQPIKKQSGDFLLNFANDSDDPRGVEILKKIDPDGDHDHYDFVSVTIGTGTIFPTLGPTNAVRVYCISKIGINYLSVNAQCDADSIGNNILNGTENITYIKRATAFYEFTDNVIYNFNGLL